MTSFRTDRLDTKTAFYGNLTVEAVRILAEIGYMVATLTPKPVLYAILLVEAARKEAGV